jgi:hypothetical protein
MFCIFLLIFCSFLLYTVMDKLERLVETLKLIATSSLPKIHAKSSTHIPENGDDGENDGEHNKVWKRQCRTTT